MFSITASGVRGMMIPSLKYQDPTSENRGYLPLRIFVFSVVSDEARERRRDFQRRPLVRPYIRAHDKWVLKHSK